MDNRTGEIEAFLRSVEGGSFAAAAKALRQTPSAVSRSVARLEARLGVRLLTRTTRSLSVTPEGEKFRAQAQKLLMDLDELERSFTTDKSEPRGRLRVSASTPFRHSSAVAGVAGVPAAVSEDHRGLVADAMRWSIWWATARMSRFATGRLRDSSLRARKLGSSRWLVVASPEYLQRHGTPQDAGGSRSAQLPELQLPALDRGLDVSGRQPEQTISRRREFLWRTRASRCD